MADYTLKLRRFDPESGEPAYWEDFDVDLPARALGARRRSSRRAPQDGSIGIRCSCQAAICGSCGVRINGKPRARLQHQDRRGRRARPDDGCDRRRADGQHAGHQGPDRRHGRRPLEEGPARRAVAVPAGRAARARVHRPGRVDDRHHAVDGLHPLRRLRLGLPVARGRPRVHRPGRARQGLPLRRRPARRRHRGPPARPRRGPARHLRLHPLLRVRRGLPEGRRADEPDHAPAPPRHRRLRDQGPQQRLRPREGVRRA